MMYALNHLNAKMAQHGIRGEVALYGGAVMCLVFNAREQTHDIDAIFQPASEIRHMAHQTAVELGLPEDWFNDGVKGFVSQNNDIVIIERMSHLNIYSATPTYMFAMKIAASRTDESSSDINDLKFLVRYLDIRSMDQAVGIISNYYNLSRIPVIAQYILHSIIDEYNTQG